MIESCSGLDPFGFSDLILIKNLGPLIRRLGLGTVQDRAVWNRAEPGQLTGGPTCLITLILIVNFIHFEKN